MTRTPQPLEIRTLLCHAHVQMASVCLASLQRRLLEPVRLVLHDDGTLTEPDIAALHAALGPHELVTAREADQRLEDRLAERPATRRFREDNPLARKLVDLMELGREDPVRSIDSDVLLLRPCTGLFDLPQEAQGLFMEDVQNAYSVRSWHLALEPRLRLPRRINTGIFAVRRSLYDPDLLEWFLAHRGFQRTRAWVEQTAWALLAGRGLCRTLDRDLVTFPDRPSAHAAVALHFVAPLRELLMRFQTAATAEGTAPVAIGSTPAKRLGPLRLALTEACRRFRR